MDLDLSILSTNLRRHRIASGKSQGEIADAAGLSRVGYRNIEAGGVAPRVDSLVRIAGVLGVQLEDLLAPVQQLKQVRFREHKMRTREELLARVGRRLADYNELEDLVGDRKRFEFRSVQREYEHKRRNRDRALEAATKAREAAGLGAQEPIRDICGLLEGNGVKMLTPKVASQGFFGLSVAADDGGPAVVVNTWSRISVERWIFTAAHELGHLILHLSAYDVERSDPDEDEEKEADAFAGYFLMPQGVFKAELEEARGLPLVDCVFKLKRIFRVSYRTVLYRIASTLPPKEGKALWPQFFAEYKRRTGRSLTKTDEPDGLGSEAFSPRPPDSSAEEPEKLLEWDFLEDRLYRLVRTAVEKDLVTLSKAAEILDLSVQDMRAVAGSWVG
jgi:Zn-dependent peptidase ImmA (M78 family)/DNA-binding XRE family transcriptional regulator